MFYDELVVRLKSIVPTPLQPVLKPVYYALFRWTVRVRCWFSDLLSRLRKDGPLPPALLRYRVSESLSVAEYRRIGRGCSMLMQSALEEAGFTPHPGKRVLDFGCGCGRTAAWFLRDRYPVEIHGADVDGQAIAWCARHLNPGRFVATSPEPPLPYPAEYFDAVYCLSVFTHLDEPMQDLWLAELHRILKPGGILLVTVYGQTKRRSPGPDGREHCEAPDSSFCGLENFTVLFRTGIRRPGIRASTS